ncbi:MAG: potassium transporter TrkG [Pseudomonadota bacterium]
MLRWLRDLPLFVALLALGIAAMYIPMAYAVRLEDWLVARTLFYHTTFLLIIVTLVGIAVSGRPVRNTARTYLVTVFGAFILIPAALALPVDYLMEDISFLQAYFEMLSCFTTTGATLFADPEVVPAPLHLLRAITGWFGGFFMLVIALSIFAPLQIGGFEIFNAARGTSKSTTQIASADGRDRLRRYSAQIFPAYLGVTALLSLGLLVSGDRMLVAVTHAMAILSTSGISPVGGLGGTQSGYLGEAFMLVFFVFAMSRHTFVRDADGAAWRALKDDKELNLALIAVLVIPALLFMRHFSAAYDPSTLETTGNAWSALWGGVFTVASFLTTTGFESQAWGGARDWSGLGTTGLILMGLAVMGGGIATTAGGIKLLRIYALYKHGQREVTRLSHPNSVAGQSLRVRLIRREGAQVAWVFFMLFVVSIAATALALSLTGMNFTDSFVFAIAGLSTTGPLVPAAGTGFIDYGSISDTAKGIFCIAMVLGRLETLAVIAVLNPNYWR